MTDVMTPALSPLKLSWIVPTSVFDTREGFHGAALKAGPVVR
jgi:hypothetical protein